MNTETWTAADHEIAKLKRELAEACAERDDERAINKRLNEELLAEKTKNAGLIRFHALEKETVKSVWATHEKQFAELTTERDEARKERDEALLKLTALGEFAVSDWDNQIVGEVDAVVGDPTKYKDRLRALFVTIPAERDALAAQLEELQAKCDTRGDVIRSNEAHITDLAAQVAELRALPFDGFAVYKALTEAATRRTSTENVADTLDAIAKLQKDALAKTTTAQ